MHRYFKQWQVKLKKRNKQEESLKTRRKMLSLQRITQATTVAGGCDS